MGHRAGVVGLAVGLWLSVGALAQDYEIKLNRPLKVGQTYRETATGTLKHKATVSVGGQAVQQKAEDFTIDFESEVTILEVDRNGVASRESHSVAKCEVVRNGVREALLAPGSILLATASDKGTKLEAQGGVVPTEIGQILDVVVDAEKDAPTDDEVLGTRERKKVGDSWPMNPDAMVRNLARHQTEARKENIHGTVTLAGLAKAGGIECLDVQGKIAFKDIRPQVGSGFEVHQSNAELTFSLKVPVDVSLARPEESVKSTLTLRAVGKPDPNGPEATLDLTIEKTATHRRTFPK